jgi:hypothetical protein
MAVSNEILNIIKQAFKIFIKEENITKTKLATVVSYSAPNAIVTIAGNITNITLSNKTGLTLASDDKVIVVILNGDITNAFIGWKV